MVWMSTGERFLSSVTMKCMGLLWVGKLRAHAPALFPLLNLYTSINVQQLTYSALTKTLEEGARETNN